MDKSSHGLWPGELKNIDNVKGISSILQTKPKPIAIIGNHKTQNQSQNVPSIFIDLRINWDPDRFLNKAIVKIVTLNMQYNDLVS